VVRIAIDATYSVDPYPSGITVYSREIITGLEWLYPQDHYLRCYRPKKFRFARNSRLLLSPLPTFRADLFHALNQRVDQRPARRVVSTFHDLFVMTGEYSSPEFRARFTEQARRAADNSDLIVAVSEFTAAQISELLRFDRRGIRVVPHGVHLPMLSEKSREKLILFVGALQRRKNILRMVEAFEQIDDEWKLVLAGAPSGYRAREILDRIELSPARQRIRVTGYVSAGVLAELYAAASIFLFPSLDEGFGIPVLEAMAHGVPVITSKRSALVEVAGQSAVLVDPEETEEIRMALSRLIADDRLRRSLAASGRRRAEAYSWERAVRSTHAVYQELLR